MTNEFIHRNKIEGYKPHRALQRDFSLIAKPYLTERGIPIDGSKYQFGGIFRAGDYDFWFDPEEQGFFTNHPGFKDTPYYEIKDLLEDVFGSVKDDTNNTSKTKNKQPFDKDADNKVEKKEIKQTIKEEMTPEEKAKIKGDIEEAVTNEDYDGPNNENIAFMQKVQDKMNKATKEVGSEPWPKQPDTDDSDIWNDDDNARFRTPTGMYDTPAIMAQIFKNNREVSDEACKKILKKRVDNMKQNWGETDEMKRQKKKKENSGN